MPLPQQPYGAFRSEEVMTYEFSVRVSDGYRWSDWSPFSPRCCFAVERLGFRSLSFRSACLDFAS